MDVTAILGRASTSVSVDILHSLVSSLLLVLGFLLFKKSLKFPYDCYSECNLNSKGQNSECSCNVSLICCSLSDVITIIIRD